MEDVDSLFSSTLIVVTLNILFISKNPIYYFPYVTTRTFRNVLSSIVDEEEVCAGVGLG